MPPTITLTSERVVRSYRITNVEPLPLLTRPGHITPVRVTVTFTAGQWTHASIKGTVVDSTKKPPVRAENRYTPEQWRSLPDWMWPLLGVDLGGDSDEPAADGVRPAEPAPPVVETPQVNLAPTGNRIALLAAIADGVILEDWYFGTAGRVRHRPGHVSDIQDIDAELSRVKAAGWCQTGPHDEALICHRVVELTDAGRQVLDEASI